MAFVGALPALLLFCAALVCLFRQQDGFGLLCRGAEQGLRTVLRIMPPLIVLLTAISMLRASGAFDLLAKWLGPVTDRVGMPAQLLPLVLVRPFSGSAALALGAELMKTYGVDSPIGRMAAVMLGSTETTFYTITVYFGAAGIRRTRYAVPAALAADLTGFLVACLSVRMLG